MTAVYNEILLPTDGGVTAKAGARHGIELAAAVGARVHALYVAHLYGEETTRTDELDAKYREYGEDVTSELCESAAAAGVDCLTAIRSGEPSGAIIEYAAENDVDLIVMATASRGEIGTSIGTTTETVIQESSIPVTTLRTSQ